MLIATHPSALWLACHRGFVCHGRVRSGKQLYEGRGDCGQACAAYYASANKKLHSGYQAREGYAGPNHVAYEVTNSNG